MKKVLLILALSLIAFSAKAQLYAGGAVSFQAVGGGTAVINLAPEVGYSFNENMGVGGILSFGTANGTNVTMRPYFRYSFLKLGDVSLFADADLLLNIQNNGNNTTTTTFGAGIRPGIGYAPARHISFAAHIGQLGYYGGGFVAGVNTNALSIAAYYVF